MRFYAEIKDGKLKLEDRQAFEKFLAKRKDGEAIFEIKCTKKSLRSQKQNRYYWGVIISLISDHTGYTPEETHEALKFKFLCKDYLGKLKIPKSTTEIKTDDFEKYLTEIRAWASVNLSLYIPLPNEIEADF